MSKIVERTLDFLELFAERKRPLSLSEISKLLDIPISSCHDVLQALHERGYVYEIAPRAGYYPTLRLLDIAKTIADNDPVVMRAEHTLSALRDSTDETVLLSKQSGATATYLLTFEPPHVLRFRIMAGDNLRSLHATSAGKAQLSSWSEEAFDNYLKTVKLTPFTPNTIVSKSALRQEIETGRKRGWLLNDEESIEGVITLSAPFVWNTAVYIVTIAGPKARLEPKLEMAVTQLIDACRSLEMRPPAK